MLSGLVWVSYRLTFCKCSNGLIPRVATTTLTNNGVVDRPWFFWVVGSIPTIHNIIMNFSDFLQVEFEKYSPRYTQEMKRLGCIDRSAGMSGRPDIPPFQGERLL